MRSVLRRWWAGLIVLVIVAGGSAAAATGALPDPAGPQPDGTAYTTYGWHVTPAGSQSPLGEKPFGAALSPDGRYLAVSDDGDNVQSLQLLDASTRKAVSRIDYKSGQDLFIGLAWSPDGSKLYASAGGNNKIRVYRHDGDSLTEDTPVSLPSGTFPAGLALSSDGSKLYAAEDGNGHVAEIDTATGHVTATAATGPNPYGVALSADGSTLYASNWGTNTVSVLDASTLAVKATMTVGSHPTAMAVNPATKDLYIAVTDADQVAVVKPDATAVSRNISVSPYAGAPVGTSPEGLAFSPDGGTLYTANAGNNDVAVIDAATGRMRGLIPTAWYPTTVTVAKDGGTLLVTNAKGLGAGPNPGGPNVTVTDMSQYVGSMIMGTLSAIPVPAGARLARDTTQVRANDRFATGSPLGGARNVIPARPGDPSPIKHVIYIVKENRTYDQVFGSLGKGDGDASLNLFGDDVAPNQRALARKFVTLDNFYADGAVSSDGWEWATASESNSYNEHLWPVAYGGRGRSDDVYTNQATDPGKITGDSRIWDRLDDAGISYRNYGMWAYDSASKPSTVYPTEPRLAAHTDPGFRALDLAYTDNSRVDAWTTEFNSYVKNQNLPTMEFLRLGDDHTYGTTPGDPTPSAMVADNDLAVGRVVDAVSHSPYWKNTAVFITEDDAQDGPDHVDAHRTTALVVSPYTQTGQVDFTHYSTVSMMRTMELIAGVGPLTQYDAMATPMTASFTSRPDYAPFSAITPQQSLTAVNTVSSPMAAQSAKMNFSGADLAPEQQLNQAVWESVKGKDDPMPPPVNAGKDDDG